MTRELLEEYLEKVSENTDFTFEITEFNDSEIELEMHGDNPCGEDWCEIIWFDGTYEGFTNAIEERVLNFDINDEVEVWIQNRGKGGCPNSIMDLLHDAEWKQKTLEKLLDDLQGNEEIEKEITKESVENRLYDFFNDKMETGDASEIERVGRYPDMYVTRDNGIVIDCKGEKQIRLIIQVD